jgi:predicted tellurium resistance membrane protein TerC
MPGDPDALSGDNEVHSITDAATPHSEEMRQRMIKYAVAMGIRMVCLILIFVVDGWFKLVPALGAVFLPWVAVIIANGGDKAEIHSDALLDYVPMSELEPPEAASGSAREPGADWAEEASMTLLQGELMDEEDGLADDEGDHGRAAS